MFVWCSAIRVRAGSRTASEAKSYHDGRNGSCYSLYFNSFGFADCGGLFREFQSWFSSSIQPNQKLHRTDVDRMSQPNLIMYFGGGELNSSLLLSFILKYSLRVSDSLDLFARYDQFAQLPVVFHILNVLIVCSGFAGAAESQQWKMRRNMLMKMKASPKANMTKTMRKSRSRRRQGYSRFEFVFIGVTVVCRAGQEEAHASKEDVSSKEEASSKASKDQR